MRKIKDSIVQFIIILSSLISVGVLIAILGFVFGKGLGQINKEFFVNEYNSSSYYLSFNAENIESNVNEDKLLDSKYKEGMYHIIEEPIYIENIGGAVGIIENTRAKKTEVVITYVEKKSPMNQAVDRTGKSIGIKEGFLLNRINGEKVEDKSLEEIVNLLEEANGKIELKVVSVGGGVFPNIVTTIYMILLSLGIAAPIGILAAIFLVEYAKPGKLVNIIRFATESLSGIPSIIFGLFGMAFFVVFLKFSLSILSGALTLSIILLPTIIRSTEEALKAVPDSYREASYGVGASKLQTIRKIIVPSAMPGILVAVILSIGRIIGESAALLLTAGTVAKIPNSLFSSGSTLTVQAYYLAKEEGNIEMACAIGIVVILLVVVLNIIAKLITRLFNRANY